MADPTTRDDLLQRIRSERQALVDVVAALDERAIVEPSSASGWSVKDDVAHLAAWQRMLVQWIEASQRGERPQRPAPGESWEDLDRLNEQIYRQNESAPWQQVWAEFQGASDQVLQKVREMSEDELFAPDAYAWRKGYPMWQLIAANTWEHYAEHRETIARR